MDGWMDKKKEYEFQKDVSPAKLILLTTMLYVLPNMWKVGEERISEIKILKC